MHKAEIVDQLLDNGLAVCEDWITTEEVEKINTLMDSWWKEGRFSPSQSNFRSKPRGKGKPEPRGKSDLVLGFKWAEADAEIKETHDRIFDLMGDINKELQLNLRELNAHFSVFPSGSGIKKAPEKLKNSNKVLYVMLFLNNEWEEQWGGELVLHHITGGERAKISPKGGTLVTFFAQDYPFEFRSTKKERRSFNGWFCDSFHRFA